MIVEDGYNIGRDWLVEKAVQGGRWKVRYFVCVERVLERFFVTLIACEVRIADAGENRDIGGKRMWSGAVGCSSRGRRGLIIISHRCASLSSFPARPSRSLSLPSRSSFASVFDCITNVDDWLITGFLGRLGRDPHCAPGLERN